MENRCGWIGQNQDIIHSMPSLLAKQNDQTEHGIFVYFAVLKKSDIFYELAVTKWGQTDIYIVKEPQKSS